MSYPIIPQNIAKDRRAEINEKIIYCIDTNKNVITKDVIYNCFTGLGGLHGLKQEDFPNFHEYTKAKKEIEMGQFFTPHALCKQLVELVSPDQNDMVLDMCCGSGNFFNHLPNQHNAYGFDIEINSVKVAKHLYPDAHIDCCDIRRYNPEQRFDIVIGNPPFNLDFNGYLSQYYYCNTAYKVLNPAGLLVFIVPCSFMQSDFWNKSQVQGIERDFSFIGQAKLPSDAFASSGVPSFETKIMVFMRESSNIRMQEYQAETFLSIKELRDKIEEAKLLKDEIRVKLMREANQLTSSEMKVFEFKLKKYLFELKMHKKLQPHLGKAIALVTKFRNQKPPMNCSDAEYKLWEKKKLTPAKVLSSIKKYIDNQNVIYRKEVALVKNNYGFRLKCYSPNMLNGIERKYVSIVDLVAFNEQLPFYPQNTDKLRKQYYDAARLIERKKKKFAKDQTKVQEIVRKPEIDQYIEGLTFINPKDKTVTRFNDLQKHDMGLFFQKQYFNLNWQQGSGKTAALWHYSKYQMMKGVVNYTFILAPANAIEGTWKTFLKCNNEKFINFKSPADFDNIPKGSTVMVSITRLETLKYYLKRFVKKANKKFVLIFDESHEITNLHSQRTRNTLEIFRRFEYKIEGTGTVVLNHIGDIYSQTELLYNNSINMLSESPFVYYENKEREIRKEDNPIYLKPYPARGGAAHFRSGTAQVKHPCSVSRNSIRISIIRTS